MTRRLAASLAVIAGAAVLVLSAILIAGDLLRGIIVLTLLVAALSATLYGLVRRGASRAIGLGLAAALLATVIVLLLTGDRIFDLAMILGCLAIATVAARRAFAVHESLPRAPAPSRPVLFINPWSGGGKAAKASLASEARARGIEPVELTRGADLGDLVRKSIARGADALAMAGGDGSQAIVAAIASEHDLPYACIPAGTRNHFALDLGVDRDDVVGALEAFADGGERRVDLGEVNGRVFVNNVSLGVYAEAVEREEYRDAKLRTILDTLPDALGPESEGGALRWRDPAGDEHRSSALILVSNNRYELGGPVGSGTRPRIDDGLLGVVVVREPGERGGAFRSPLREMSIPSFDVDSEGRVPTGIDGESVVLDPPLRFRIRPGALRVRIAAGHPGASPSRATPSGPAAFTRALVSIATGREAGTPAAI